MNKFIKSISKVIPDKSDFFLLFGIAFIFWGIYQISIPISFIVTGVLFSAVGVITALPTKKVGN